MTSSETKPLLRDACIQTFHFSRRAHEGFWGTHGHPGPRFQSHYTNSEVTYE